jgi:hypothetical protein
MLFDFGCPLPSRLNTQTSIIAVVVVNGEWLCLNSITTHWRTEMWECLKTWHAVAIKKTEELFEFVKRKLMSPCFYILAYDP